MTDLGDTLRRAGPDYDASYPPFVLDGAPWTWNVADAAPTDGEASLDDVLDEIVIAYVDRAGIDRGAALTAYSTGDVLRFAWSGGVRSAVLSGGDQGGPGTAAYQVSAWNGPHPPPGTVVEIVLPRSAPPPPPPPPPPPVPGPGWVKADIRVWLDDHGVTLDDDAYAALTKPELLDLVEDLLDDDVDDPVALALAHVADMTGGAS